VCGGDSVIGGGISNIITGTIPPIRSTIAGGASNTICRDTGFIGGGRNNLISGTTGVGEDAVIGGGASNKTYGVRAAILGGCGNCLGCNSYGGGIVSGNNNRVAEPFGIIGGGSVNVTCSPHSIIGGGALNFIGNSQIISAYSANTCTLQFLGNYSSSFSVNDLLLTYDNLGCSRNVVVTGFTYAYPYTNLFVTGATASVGAFPSSQPYIRNLTTSSGGFCQGFIGGGIGNTVSGTTSSIVGGKVNTITTAVSFIGGGLSNSVTGSYSTIGGGAFNQAIGSSSFIGGGSGNCACGSNTTIGGGLSNKTYACRSTIGGGANNYACGVFSTIAGGFANFAIGYCSFVGSGWNNRACGNRSSIVGGTFNVATGCYSSIVGGSAACAPRFGQRSFASGGWIAFGGCGVSQQIDLVGRNTTTGATPVNIFLDGSTQRISVLNETAMFVTINIAGITSGGTSAAHYIRKVAIKNVGGTTSLIGTVSTIGTDVEDNASYDVTITADNTNDALDIQVTGVVGDTMRWTVHIEGVEIKYSWT